MKKFLFSIKDTVTQQYSAPMLFVNEAEALRTFNYQMSKLPLVNKDSALYLVGSFDTDTCDVVPGVSFVANYSDIGGDVDE